MKPDFFTIERGSKVSGARVGRIRTRHGVIETPALVIVGTRAEVRCLTPEDLPVAGVQAVIANTYHLWQEFAAGGVQDWNIRTHFNWSGPLLTDSGGFQVFSFGFAREHRVGKISNIFPEDSPDRLLSAGRGSANFPRPEKNLVRVTEDGAHFTTAESREQFLGPRESIRIQEKLGADIVFAFDECTSPLNDYEYTRAALERTHRWAEVCLAEKTCPDQFLFGIVQGGEYKDLRERSADFMGRLPFDGFAIGGSLGQSRRDMLDVIRWSLSALPAEKPRHLLGIGRIKDIFDGVERGIDTFDCVIPTREARHGRIWLKPEPGLERGFLDIKRGAMARDTRVLTEGCACPVCVSRLTRANLHELFKARAPEAARLATLHNVWFFNNLMAEIREAISRNALHPLRAKYLANFL